MRVERRGDRVEGLGSPAEHGAARRFRQRTALAVVLLGALSVGVGIINSHARALLAAAPVPILDGRPSTLVPRVSIARLQYDGGGDWYANPSSLPNLLEALAQRTTLDVDRTEGQVTLMDERLWDYPFLHATGHGNMKLSDAEVARLREYLLRGGFLHVSDNYGLDESFRREIARVFPDRPLVDVPLTHPIYHIVYDFPKGVPKIHEHDGKPARGLGIFIGDRLAVFYDYQCDLGNGWEDVGTYPGDPPALHEEALRMGVNLVVYAVTSRPAS
jgi:Domain of unknown function (DUF4159)